MSEKTKSSQRTFLSSRVLLDEERAIVLNGQTYQPDRYSAYIEFYLGHAFPVVTSDQTAMLPQVVENSYRSLRHKVFNLGHIMVANNPEENARDRILGTILDVEFPQRPAGGWQVTRSRAAAPGIRAVAVVHRQAEGVADVLRTYRSQQVRWTVSMEQEFPVDAETESIAITSGFLVRACPALEDFAKGTPADLRGLGWTYVPCGAAPEELQRCFEVAQTRCLPFRGLPTVLLFGGLDGAVQFKGTGLTPLGKEAEARVAQMLASGMGADEIEELAAAPGDLTAWTAPLAATLNIFR